MKFMPQRTAGSPRHPRSRVASLGDGVVVRQFTDAPLRQLERIELPADPGRVFRQLCDPTVVRRWMARGDEPTLVHRNGMGSCVYEVRSVLPLRPQVVVFKVESDGSGSTKVHAQSYFNATRGLQILLQRMALANVLRGLIIEFDRTLSRAC